MSDKSKKQSRREQIRQRQKRQQGASRSIFIVAAAILVGFVGYLIWTSTKPPPDPVGISTEPMESANHVEDGTDVEYSTNPPTSGPHYAQPLPAGFYNVGDINVPFVESHIVHSMEHGYVIFWYNCSNLSLAGCNQLKDQISAVLAEVGDQKVVVFPWDSIEEPLVMTSWGQMLRFDTFDADLAADFVLANRSNPRAPEPNVP